MMRTRSPKGSTPPYVSSGVQKYEFDLFAKLRPEQIDERWLLVNGVTQGNAFALLSANRYLGITDDAGNVTDPRLLTRLGNPQERPAALKELVDEAYADLIQQTDLETATIKTIDLYFQYQRVKPSISSKAARYFVWIAQEAGYKLAEEVKPTLVRRSTAPPRQSGNKRDTPVPNEVTPDDEDQQETDVPEIDEYEEELLRILLDKLKESDEMPSTEIIREIKSLIASVKGRSSEME